MDPPPDKEFLATTGAPDIMNHLAYAMRRAGWNVLIPHDRGSWAAKENSLFQTIEDTWISA